MLLKRLDGHLHYDLIGDPAAPVVCMTHSLTSDGGMWAEQVGPLLAAGYQVLRLDMRGHGGSRPFPGPYTIEALAADAVAILDALAMGPVHMVGLSMGGMIGQVIAADHPGRLASLMACCTTCRWEGDDGLMRRRMAEVDRDGTLENIVDDNMVRRYSDAFRARRPERWQALRQTFLGTTLPGYLGCMAAILAHDVSARLDRVRLPTLVLAGSDDIGTPPAANREIAARIAGAEYVEIPGGRHFPNVEFDTEFNRIMLDWLARTRALA